MESKLSELKIDEMMNTEGGNPVVVYGALALGKYVVIPAAKIVAEAVVTAFVVSAIGDMVSE